MWGSHIWLFPVAVFVSMPLNFFTSYAIAVSNGHVAAGFPFISDTGTQPPESCIFGQLLNISAVLAGITIYIRFRDVEECNVRRETIHHTCCQISRINVAAFVLGLISALGASIVANFQESNVLVVHLIGAFMTFCVGAVYCWIQTYLSYKLCGARKISHIRLFLCLTITIFFIILMVSTPVAMGKFSGWSTKHWRPEDGGFAEHIVSTVSEWAMAIAMMFYFLTFVKEFRDFGLRSPIYYRHSELEVSPPVSEQLGLEKNGDLNSVMSTDQHHDETPHEGHLVNGSREHIMTT